MKIVVTSPSFSKDTYLRDFLKREIDFNIVFNDSEKRFAKDELVNYLSDADAAIVGLEIIDEELLEKLPKLKFIAKYGVGLDNIDLAACQKRGIKIGWKGGVNRLSVAEMAIGFMISLKRNLIQSNVLMRQGIWKKNGGTQLTGSTVGIVGFGFIGQEVAKLLAPFQCKILVNDILNKSDEAARLSCTCASLEEIFESSDIITLHIPFNEKNKYFLNSKSFSMMMKSPIVLNTSRGGIVNEKDILMALNSGLVSSYAVDTFEDEPTTNTELIMHPSVFGTPHIGGNSKEAIRLMGESAVVQLKEIISYV